MRRVGKGFSGVETPLFEGDTDGNDETVNAGDAAEGDVIAAHGEVPTVDEEPSIPSPTPCTPPTQPSQDILSTSQLKRRVKKMKRRNKVSVLKLRRLQRVRTAQRVKTSDETVLDDESNQERMIAEMDHDADVVLEDDKEVADEAKEVADAIKDVEEIVTAASETITAASTNIIAAEAQVLAAITTVTLTAAPARVTAAPTKKQKLDEEVEELKRHLQIVPNEDDDVYIEATPLARKRVKKFERRNKVGSLKLRRLQKVGTSQRVETSDDTVMDDVSNQERMIAEMDQDADVVLEDDKEDDREVVDVVKDVKDAKVDERSSRCCYYCKIITKVVTTASETITAASTNITTAEAQVPAATLTAAPARVTAAPSRRRKGVVIRDLQEESTTSTIIPAETKSKDKGKGILVEEPKLLKKKQQIKQDKKYVRELHAELNKNIDWDEVIKHVKINAKEDPAVKKYQAL
nr:hypothetical protein [Tanacetum cinerariifolium]